MTLPARLPVIVKNAMLSMNNTQHKTTARIEFCNAEYRHTECRIFLLLCAVTQDLILLL